MMERMTTEEYPVRYVAHDAKGVLVEADKKIRDGGREWAVYHSDLIHAEIISYQDKRLLLLMEDVKNGRLSICKYYDYANYEEAIKHLMDEIGNSGKG